MIIANSSTVDGVKWGGIQRDALTTDAFDEFEIGGCGIRTLEIATGKTLLESVTFQLHDRMLSSFSATSLKSNGHFRTFGSRLLSGTTMVKNIDFPV